MYHAHMDESSNEQQALSALRFIIPILEKYQFRWLITGGFATYVYGVERPLNDIDIDIDTSVNAPEFLAFTQDLQPFVTWGPEHYVDQNYDNYSVEVTYEGQILDICPMAEMNIYSKELGRYENFYKDGFPTPEHVDFGGLKLPLLPKKLIIKNKETLVWQRESDSTDIAGLTQLLSRSS